MKIPKLTEVQEKLLAKRKEVKDKDEDLYRLIDNTLYYLEQLEEVKRVVK